MTVISYAHNVIFLKTRKTAGTSMELWLSTIAGPDDVLAPVDPADEQLRATMGAQAQNCWIPARRYHRRDYVRRAAGRRPMFLNHMTARDVRAYVGEGVWNSFLKVTVERDPYDRAVSMFRFKTQELPHAPDLLAFLHRCPRHLLANAPIYSIDGEVVADAVLDYASLSADTAALQRLLGVPASPLPRAKISKGRPAADSRTLLGPEGCRIVERACRDDIALALPHKRMAMVGSR